MKFSNKTYAIKQSLTRQLFDLAKQYNDVIDLTLGDPDLTPCYEIKNAACKAILDGNTHYSSNAGLIETRKAISKFASKEYNTEIKYNDIMVTVGGMEAIYLLLNSFLNKDDEVIIFSPYYVNYVQMTYLCEAVPVIIPFKNDGDFSIDIDEFNKKISSKTKLIIINSPNNPTGRIIPEHTIRQIAKTAIENNIFVISDEVYKSLIYNEKFFSIFSIEEIKNNCAIIDSMSKRYSMTGYRLGYVICKNAEVIDCMIKLQENMVACAPLPSQYAAIEAYGNDISNDFIKSEFLKRRNFILKKLQNIDGFKINDIDATFYAFVDISSFKMSSIDFAMKLLEHSHVAVVPGITYGDNCDSYIRIAFTKNIDVLENAIKRIEEFTKFLKGE